MALIKVGYACNNNCVFCHSTQSRGHDDSDSGVAARIRRARQLGCATVVLSGGEPGMRRELLGWARLAHGLGLGFGLVSNGRMLAYAGLATRLTRLGLVYAQLSLHAGDAAQHDQLTASPGSFDQTVQGVQNLWQSFAAHGGAAALTVNAVVTSGNLEQLRPLAELLRPHAGLRLKFSMVEPRGAALARFEELVPPLSQVAARVAEALDHARRVAPQLQLAHEGLPLCLLDEHHRSLTSGLRADGFSLMSEAHERDFFPVHHHHHRVQPRSCHGCSAAGACPGVYREYLRRRSVQLVPLAGSPPAEERSA